MAETKKNTMLEDLIKAQRAIDTIEKDAKNPYFKSNYASLTATIAACKQVLNDNNFVVLQPIQSDENGVFVCTTLIHTSGEKIESKMAIRESKDKDPQSQGSAITYARRYSLKSLLCMADDDDDGEKAQTSYRTPPQKPAQTSGLTTVCKIHNETMTERISQKTNTPYFAHTGPDGKLCFGRPVKFDPPTAASKKYEEINF